MVAIIHFWKEGHDPHIERFDGVTNVVFGKEAIEIHQKLDCYETSIVYKKNDFFQYIEIREKDLFSKEK